MKCDSLKPNSGGPGIPWGNQAGSEARIRMNQQQHQPNEKPTERTPAVGRRQFLQGVAGLPLAAAAAEAFQQTSGQRRAAPREKFCGIQMTPWSMFDEGIDHVLDFLKNEAGINSVMVYSHTYYSADGIRRKRSPDVLAPDHGIPVRDLNKRNLPFVWVKQHDEYYKDTFLRQAPVDPNAEYANRDLFAEMLEPCRKRGMKLYARILEPFTAEMADVLPNWPKVLTVDVYGGRAAFPASTIPITATGGWPSWKTSSSPTSWMATSGAPSASGRCPN